MSNKGFVVTPRHVYQADTQVFHACELEDAVLLAVRKEIETGKEWGVYKSIGAVEVHPAIRSLVRQSCASS